MFPMFQEIQSEISSNPYMTRTVAVDRPNTIIGNRRGIRWIIEVDFERITVIAIQSIRSAEPHISIPVLFDGDDTALGHTICQREALEGQRAALRVEGKEIEDGESYDSNATHG